MTVSENAPFFVSQEVIRLTKNGTWLSDDTEITHEPTCKLFSRSIQKDDQGYFLKVSRETKRIEVEDTAYFVERIDGDLETGIWIHLSHDTKEKLKPETLKYRPGRLVCQIQNREEARFLHESYFSLLSDLKENQDGYYLEFGKQPHSTVITLASR